MDPDHRLLGHDADLARSSRAGPCGRSEALADLRPCGRFRGSPRLRKSRGTGNGPGAGARGGSCERHRLEFLGHAGRDHQRAGGRGHPLCRSSDGTLHRIGRLLRSVGSAHFGAAAASCGRQAGARNLVAPRRRPRLFADEAAPARGDLTRSVCGPPWRSDRPHADLRTRRVSCRAMGSRSAAVDAGRRRPDHGDRPGAFVPALPPRRLAHAAGRRDLRSRHDRISDCRRISG